jgi:rhodanese-related sulfurtransferase
LDAFWAGLAQVRHNLEAGCTGGCGVVINDHLSGRLPPEFVLRRSTVEFKIAARDVEYRVHFGCVCQPCRECVLILFRRCFGGCGLLLRCLGVCPSVLGLWVWARQLETHHVVVSHSHVIEEVSVEETWARLANDPNSVLIDVRTQAEWAFVGVPELSRIGKQPLLIEWQGFPDNRVHTEFAQRLGEALTQNGMDQSTELLFLCRSGGRSLMAARTMQAAGYGRCRNVSGGFEGGLDPQRHRGLVEGWKAKTMGAGLTDYIDVSRVRRKP